MRTSLLADIVRYQSVLKLELLKVNFSVTTGIYMLPSNLNVSVGKTVELNYEILISNIYMNKIGSSKDISKVFKNIWCCSKVMKSSDNPIK